MKNVLGWELGGSEPLKWHETYSRTEIPVWFNAKRMTFTSESTNN